MPLLTKRLAIGLYFANISACSEPEKKWSVLAHAHRMSSGRQSTMLWSMERSWKVLPGGASIVAFGCTSESVCLWRLYVQAFHIARNISLALMLMASLQCFSQPSNWLELNVSLKHTYKRIFAYFMQFIVLNIDDNTTSYADLLS